MKDLIDAVLDNLANNELNILDAEQEINAYYKGVRGNLFDESREALWTEELATLDDEDISEVQESIDSKIWREIEDNYRSFPFHSPSYYSNDKEQVALVEAYKASH